MPCSTCNRVVISRKNQSAVCSSTRNSTVPTLLYFSCEACLIAYRTIFSLNPGVSQRMGKSLRDYLLIAYRPIAHVFLQSLVCPPPPSNRDELLLWMLLASDEETASSAEGDSSSSGRGMLTPVFGERRSTRPAKGLKSASASGSGGRSGRGPGFAGDLLAQRSLLPPLASVTVSLTVVPEAPDHCQSLASRILTDVACRNPQYVDECIVFLLLLFLFCFLLANIGSGPPS